MTEVQKTLQLFNFSSRGFERDIFEFPAGAEFCATCARVFLKLRFGGGDGSSRQYLDGAARAAGANGKTRIAFALPCQTTQSAFHNSIFERVETNDDQTARRL